MNSILQGNSLARRHAANPIHSRSQIILARLHLAVVAGCVAFGGGPLLAANLYWDANGPTAGAGGATPTGTWGLDNYWSTAAAGTVATAAWSAGETAVFSAGIDATGTFSINVSGPQVASGITLEEGNITLLGGELSLGSGAAVSVAAGQSLTLDTLISGTSWSKVGTGPLSLKQANTFTGPLTITGNAVRFDHDLAAGSGSVIISPINSVYLQTGSGGITLTNPIVLNEGAGLDVSALAGTFTLNGNISGTRLLWTVGAQAANTVVLGGHNSFSANVKINGGTLIVTRDNALGTDGGNTEVTAGATLGFQGGFNYNTAEVIKLFGTGVGGNGALRNISGINQFSGPIDLQTHTTVGAAGGSSLALGGTILGPAFNVTKVGAGIVVVKGLANNYGATTVSEGTLLVDTTLGSGAVTVASGAVLGGNGVAAGTVNLSGEISPGTSPGTLASGAQVWYPDASYLWDINEAFFGVSGGDPGWDLLDIAGSLTINATPADPFVIKLSSLNQFSNLPGMAGGFFDVLDYDFVIAQTTGGITGFAPDNVVIDQSWFQNYTGAGIFVLQLTNSNNDLVLRFVHPAFIVTQPASTNNECSVENTSLSVVADGTGGLSYQWYHDDNTPVANGGNISGATTPTLSFNPATLADTDGYYCVITNLYGATTSLVATLTVSDTIAPAITCPPTVAVDADPGLCVATGVSLGTPSIGLDCDPVPFITNNAALLFPAGFPVGTNVVVWSVTDASTNTSICNQLVIVTDTQLPDLVITDISRQLDPSGDYTLTAADIAEILAGSSDNCGLFSTNLSETVFNFCDLGVNPVTVTLTDVNGNSANASVDITLTAPATPLVVYVDDDYPATCAGVNFPSNGVAGPYYVGFNAFNTIQAGIDAVAVGGTVHVAAGIYEELVEVDKPVSILGPNSAINPNTGLRVSEAVLQPSLSDPDPDTSSVVLMYVTTDDVAIRGLTLDGDNPALTSGVVRGGADIDAIEGIASYEGVGSIVLENNIIKNLSYTGVDFYNYYNFGAATSGNSINENRFLNIGTTNFGFGVAVLIYNNFYTEILDNHMLDVRVGIQTGNYYQANPGPTAAVIAGNEISSWRRGVFYNLHYASASPFALTNNIITAQDSADVSLWDAMLVSSQQGSVTSIIGDNTINGGAATQLTVGYQVWNCPAAAGAVFTGGTITDCDYGVWINNFDGYGPSNGDSSTMTVNGVAISGAGLAGVYVKDNALNSNGAIVHASLNGGSVSNSAVGLLVEGADASIAPGNVALGNLSGDYIQLVNGAAQNVDATSVLFDGVTGVGMSLATLFATEDRIDHATDLAGLGLVRVKVGNVYVTQNSGSIQRGINPASPGDTVTVNDGAYTESLNVNKALTLLSANGFANTTIAGNSQTAVTIAADDVILRGFTVTNPGGKRGIYAANRSRIFVSENRFAEIGNSDVTVSGSNFGVAVESTSAAVDDIQIVNNVISNLFGGSFKSAQAIAVGFSTGSFDITGVVIRSNRISQVSSATNVFASGGRGAYGVILNHTTASAGKTVGAQISENEITDMIGLWAHGIGLEGNTPGAVVQSNLIARLTDYKSPSDPDAVGVMVEQNASANTVTISLNSFTDVWLGVRNVTALPVNAESNWWESASGPAATANPGGTGVGATALVDFSPWLGDGSDIAGWVGFQPNLSPVYHQPDHLVFATSPSDADLAQVFPTQPVVHVIDENGGVATQFSGSVTVTIGSNPGGGVLVGTTTVPVVAGVATFSDLAITTGGGVGYTLTAATASPIIGAASAPFDIGNPSPILFSLNPAGAVTGSGGGNANVTLTGTNFVPSSVVLVDGSPMTTVFVSVTELTASLSTVAPGSFSVVVSNPPPVNTGLSGALTFTVGDMPPVVYVDDDYGPGNAGGHSWGYDAFSVVQDGVNAVATNGTVNVAAGNYAENVSITKTLSLLGADAGTPCAGTGQSVIDGGAGTTITILAAGVTVDGFALLGATGLSDAGFVGLVVQNNSIAATAAGITLQGIPGAFTLQDNCVALASQLAGGTPTVGITLAGTLGAATTIVADNHITNAFYGYLLYAVNTTPAVSVSGGTISGVMQGVAVINVDPVTFIVFAPATFTVDGVSMSGFAGDYTAIPALAGANFHAGVYVFSSGSSAAAKITGLLTNLNITGTGPTNQSSAGIYLGDFSTGLGARQEIVIAESSITNNMNRGVFARGSNAVATVTRSLIADNGNAPYGTGGNDGFGIVAREGATLTASNNFISNPASVAGGYSVTALAAHTGAKVTAINNSVANNGSPTGRLAHNDGGSSLLNASGNWWDDTSEGAIAGLMLGAIDFTPFLASGTDTDVSAGFQGDFSTLHVTLLGAQTGIIGRIQEGINLTTASTVFVGPGVFAETVVINKNGLTLTGAGTGVTIVDGPGCPTSLVGIEVQGSRSNLLITDLTVREFNDGMTMLTGPANNIVVEDVELIDNCRHGFWSQAFGINGLTFNRVDASRNNFGGGNSGRGIWVINGSKTNVVIQDGVFNQNGLVGIDISDGNATDVQIIGNEVAGNGDSGIGLLGPKGPGANLVAFNTVTNNGRYGIEIKNPTGSGLAAGSGSVVVVSNLVVRNVAATDARDHAAILAMRRFPVLADNADQPTGAYIAWNEVRGYRRKPFGSTGDGYGVVVGGEGHRVLHNQVTDCDIAFQVQGGNTADVQNTPFFDRDSAASGGALFAANINTGNGIGFRAGGSTAKAILENNSLTGDVQAGIQVQLGATVDAGDCSGSNVTGLGLGSGLNGSSIGGNNLSGYGFDGIAPTAIENLNPAGPVVLAFQNLFGAAPGDNIAQALVQTSPVQYSQSGGLMISCLPAATVECPTDSLVLTPATNLLSFLALGGMASASDPVIVTHADDLSGLNLATGEGTISRTYTLTDACGATANCTQIITVDDTTVPTISCPATVTVNADAGNCFATGVGLGLPVTGDNCGVLTVTNDAPATFTIGNTSVTWTVVDNSGLTATCNQTVTVLDAENPSLTCPADIVVNRLDATDPYATGYPITTDNCTNLTVTFNDNRAALTNCNATGFILRTWTATDGASNSVSCVQTITVVDSVAPLFTSTQTNLTVVNDAGDCGALVNFPTPTAVDLGYVQGFEDLGWFAGHHVTQPSVDWNSYTSPMTRVPSGTDGVASKSGAAHAVIDAASSPGFTGAYSRLGGYDSSFGTGFRTAVDVYIDLGNPGVTGATLVDGYGWHLSTAVNNQANGHRRDFIFHTAAYGAASSNGVVVAASNNSTPARRNDLLSLANHHIITNTGWYTFEWVFRDNGSGVLAVDCQLRDENGLLLFTETRSDASDLIATVVGGNRYLWFTYLGVDKLAVDNVNLERNASVICDLPSGSVFPVGTNSVACIATDACGNPTTNTFTITVEDVEPPTISCAADIVQAADFNECFAAVSLVAPGGGDNCGIGSLTNDALSQTIFPVGTNLVTWLVTDVHGNTNSCVQTVVVLDDQLPSLVLPADINTVADPGVCHATVSLGLPLDADNCGVLSYTNDAVSQTQFPVGITLVTWTVTDVHGNTSNAVQTVTVLDTQPPILVASPIATGYQTALDAQNAALAATTIAENCLLTNVAVVVIGDCSATITVTAWDSSGNSASTNYSTRIDDVPPTISSVTATQIQPDVVGVVDVKDCANSAVQGVVNFAVTASDPNCSLAAPPGLTLTNGVNYDTAVYVNESPAGTFNYTWTVGVSTPTGTWTATVTADDLANTTVSNFTVCVDTAQITGLVEMEGFNGSGTAPQFTRTVTFVATTNDVVYGTNVLKTWVVTLTNAGPGDTFAYTLAGVPPNANGLSAKTDWSLRDKLAIALDINGQATADFVSDGTPGWSDATDHYLRGGDIGDSIMFPASLNRVLTDDYFEIVGAWLGSDPAADITGDGIINVIDYSILAGNWTATGDPQ